MDDSWKCELLNGVFWDTVKSLGYSKFSLSWSREPLWHFYCVSVVICSMQLLQCGQFFLLRVAVVGKKRVRSGALQETCGWKLFVTSC